jgi:hypothetical protein
MPLNQQHDLHRRRYGRNLGLGLALGALVLIVMGLTVAKVERDMPGLPKAEVVK